MRHVFKNIIAHIGFKQHTIILGVTGCGKSSLLKMVRDELLSRHLDVSFINLNDVVTLLYLNDGPEKIFRFIQHPDSVEKKPQYLLLEDIHLLKDPSKLLDYLYNNFHGQIKVICTSSEVFFKNELEEDLLPGKKKVHALHSLNFDEFLQWKDRVDLIRELQVIGIHTNQVSKKHDEINKLLEEYLLYGGLPEVVLTKKIPGKIKLLHQIKHDLIKKDGLIKNIEQKDKFIRLISEIALKTSQPVNRNDLSRLTGLSNVTTGKYLRILEHICLITLLEPYHRFLPKEMAKMPKMYFNDLGLRNAFIDNFQQIPYRSDKKYLLDNFFFLQMRQLVDEKQLFYWRASEQQSIDLIVNGKKSMQHAYVIKWREEDFKASKFRRFRDYYPNNTIELFSADFIQPSKWIFTSIAPLFLKSLEEEVFAL
ncbi:MAG: AAA family ATPase [Chitinophagales bacterium]|nr:AAA family ATPase [Chitinophagales bacterium]